jgi:hypothetical protein
MRSDFKEGLGTSNADRVAGSLSLEGLLFSRQLLSLLPALVKSHPALLRAIRLGQIDTL